MSFRFSSDPAEMDRARIHSWLSTESYWAEGRTREKQDRAMDGSLNFGMFDAAGEQVAYARVITDGATFAWLCDVFVSVGVRGQGAGVQLIEGVIAHLEPLGLGRVMLATADAHGLYARFGFGPLDKPELLMARSQ